MLRIKELRKSKGLTQDDIVAASGISNVALENNKLAVMLHEAIKCISLLERKRRLQQMDVKQIADFIKNGGAEIIGNADFLAYLTKYLPNIPNQSTRAW